MEDIRLAEGSPREVGIFTRASKHLKLRFSPAARPGDGPWLVRVEPFGERP